MNKQLIQTLHTFSHFNDKSIFENCLSKASASTLEKINSVDEEMNLLLYELNSHISIKEVLQKIFELEANIYILESALNGFEDYTYGEIEEFNTHFKTLNRINKQTIKELCVMLENKELTTEKKST